MYRIGLSGNRYSGKDRVSKLFKQIMVPVFNADAVLKFILNWDYKVLGEIKLKLGSDLFHDGKLDFKKVSQNGNFDKILDFVEPIIMKSYSDFEKKNPKAIYTIFHYSLLFERNINNQMYKNISVFAPDNIRMNRSIFMTNEKITTIDILLKKEMCQFEKNKISDFVVHNYEMSDVYDKVNQIDRQIVDEFLNIKESSKIEIVNKNFIKIK